MFQYNLTCLHSRLKILQSKSLTKTFQTSLLFSTALSWCFLLVPFYAYCTCVVSLLAPKLPSTSTMLTESGTNHWGKDLIYSLLPLGAPPSTTTQRSTWNTRKVWKKGPDPFFLELKQQWHICQQITASLSTDLHILSSCSQPPCLTPGHNPRKKQDPCP